MLNFVRRSFLPSIRVLFALVLIIASVFTLPAQPQTATPQPLVLLQQSLSALTSGQTPADVTLTGMVRRIAGSDDETGSVVLKAMSDGHSRIDLNLPSGTRSEIRSLDVTGSAVGAWAGPDAVQHAISYHNLLTDSSWFFSAFALARITSSQGMVDTYIGEEALNASQSCTSLSRSRPAALPD